MTHGRTGRSIGRIPIAGFVAMEKPVTTSHHDHRDLSDILSNESVWNRMRRCGTGCEPNKYHSLNTSHCKEENNKILKDNLKSSPAHLSELSANAVYIIMLRTVILAE